MKNARPQRPRLDQCHSKSDGRMDCESNNGGISLGSCPATPHSRSGSDLRYHRTRRLRAMGIRDKPTAPTSPWQNSFAERLIGSIRRECVDHFVVLGEAHLRRILRPMLAITTTSERTGHWIKMRRSLAPFIGPESLVHTRSLADFITTTSGCRFSVHTGGHHC
jgi:transposase InsO family protein